MSTNTRSKWTTSPGGDHIHPDWAHTIDGDYRPKGCSYTTDGDLELSNGMITTQERLDYLRESAGDTDYL